MNRILDFDEKLAYVTVEPGVTQGQLYAFLQGRGSRLWMDATGASPASSLVGNAVERGFGHTPYGDHFANTCGLEVVLPRARRSKPDFRALPNRKPRRSTVGGWVRRSTACSRSPISAWSPG